MSKVLITGGSGYVANHCILKALDAGHEVRTSLRTLRRADDVRSAVSAGGLKPDLLDRLTFFEADLNHDEGWSDAVEGCDYVLHVASPFPTTPPSDPMDIIRPARDGTIRVLKASIAAGVSRVVMTSSFAAIGYGHEVTGRPFDERDWTDVNGPGVHPYIQSKAIAERAAWDFVTERGENTELSVINPTGIFGPALSRHLSSSVDLVRQLLAGDISVAPMRYFGVVDVRDVADLHMRVMITPSAASERFLATTEPQETLLSIAKMLGDVYPSLRDRLPKREFAAENADLPDSLGVRRPASAAKARALGWSPRSAREAILDTAESLIELGIVTRPSEKPAMLKTNRF
jgi:dihydroflavonol-4-reductase